MRFQDQIIETTNRTIEGIFRTARAVPEDKLDWKPMDNGRTVLDQIQEVSQAPMWFLTVLEKKADPKFTPEQFQQAREARQAWDSLDKCEEVCKANSEKLFEQIRNLSDEDLSTPIKFEGSDREYTLADIALFHHTHLNYHIGQINYIQTLYGDTENH